MEALAQRLGAADAFGQKFVQKLLHLLLHLLLAQFPKPFAAVGGNHSLQHKVDDGARLHRGNLHLATRLQVEPARTEIGKRAGEVPLHPRRGKAHPVAKKHPGNLPVPNVESAGAHHLQHLLQPRGVRGLPDIGNQRGGEGGVLADVAAERLKGGLVVCDVKLLRQLFGASGATREHPQNFGKHRRIGCRLPAELCRVAAQIQPVRGARQGRIEVIFFIIAQLYHRGVELDAALLQAVALGLGEKAVFRKLRRELPEV